MSCSRSRKMVLLAFSLSLVSGMAIAQTEATPPLTFAGGASAITEVHGDWTLICGTYEEEKACVVTQNLSDNESGQRMLSIELEALPDGSVSGSLVLPFGLSLSDGVRAQIDAVAVGEAQPFAACYDYGCLVNLSFNASSTELLRRGTQMRFLGTIADSGEGVALSLPLRGVSSALNRGAALLAN